MKRAAKPPQQNCALMEGELRRLTLNAHYVYIIVKVAHGDVELSVEVQLRVELEGGGGPSMREHGRPEDRNDRDSCLRRLANHHVRHGQWAPPSSTVGTASIPGKVPGRDFTHYGACAKFWGSKERDPKL